MRVLNIDLDFFLNDRAHGRPDRLDSRPDNWGLVPWKAEDVIQYVEEFLNVKKGTPGKIVLSHHEVFFYWRRVIAQGRLTVPFFITHVDAHSDLGSGTPGWVYLHSEFLKLSLAQRSHPKEGDWGMNFANYMAFAIGNRWFNA